MWRWPIAIEAGLLHAARDYDESTSWQLTDTVLCIAQETGAHKVRPKFFYGSRGRRKSLGKIFMYFLFSDLTFLVVPSKSKRTHSSVCFISSDTS